VATKLRNRPLFDQYLIYCLGPWHAPVYHHIKDDRLREAANAAYEEVALHVTDAHRMVVNLVDGGIGVGPRSPPLSPTLRNEMKMYMNEASSELIQSDARLSLPAYYRDLMNFKSIDGSHPFSAKLEFLMENNLKVIDDDANAGEGYYRDYFLCAWVSSENFPYDDEVDW
jgi:hypothetical protein